MAMPAGDKLLQPDSIEFWVNELTAAKKDREDFTEEARETVRRYLHDEDEFDQGTPVNMFWSNVQVMTGILYANPPKADARRRNNDANDDAARVAGTIIERILNADIELDDSTLESAWRRCVWDWLVPGLGQVWMRYDANIGPVTDSMGSPVLMENGAPAEKIMSEDVLTEYVHWSDFSWSPARTWEEVTWVSRRVYMARDAVEKRWGEDVADNLPYASRNKDDGADIGFQNDEWRRAQVFEIWHKPTRTVQWVAQGYDKIIERIHDPLQVSGFWPCPEPLVMNPTTSRLMPKALYYIAKELYRQVDEISNRIKWLTRACKITGIYDQNAPGIKELFKQGVELNLLPVENWAALSEKGGLRGSMEIVSVEQIAATIEKLRMEKAARVGELYEVLGLSDIMRGMANKVETATTQQLKSQYGSSRMSVYGNVMERWVSESLSLRGEIMVRHFQPQTLIERSGVMRTADAPLAQQAIELLKQPDQFRWRVKVRSQSMTATDWAAEKMGRSEFMTALGGLLQSAGPIMKQMPGSMPFFLELMKWVASGFRIGKEIETVLDAAVAAIRAQPPQPDPMQQAETQKTQAEAGEARANAMLAAREAAMPPGMMPQ